MQGKLSPPAICARACQVLFIIVMVIEFFLFAMEYILNLDFNDVPKYQTLIQGFEELSLEEEKETTQTIHRPRANSRNQRKKKLSDSIFNPEAIS